LAFKTSGEEEAGDVGAGHQQKGDDGPGESGEAALFGGVEDGVAQGFEEDGAALDDLALSGRQAVVGGKVGRLESMEAFVHFDAEGVAIDAGSEAANDGDPCDEGFVEAIPSGCDLRLHVHGDEEGAGIALLYAVEALRSHTDEGVGHAVYFDGAADEGGVGGEARLPVGVGDDGDGVAEAGTVVIGAEEAAEVRTQAEGFEVGAGDEFGFDAFGSAAAGAEVDPGGEGAEEVGEGFVAGERLIEGVIETAAVDGGLDGEPDEFFGVVDGDEAEQGGVDEGEERGGGSDAEGEREDGGGGEAGGAAEAAESVTEVGGESVKMREGAMVAAFLFDGLERAEFEEGLAAGFFFAHAGFDVEANEFVEVLAEFVVEFLVCGAAVEEGHGVISSSRGGRVRRRRRGAASGRGLR